MTQTPTDRQIAQQYESGLQDVDSLIAPLIELSRESSSLVLGYGQGENQVRENMIPYFHVSGTPGELSPVRVLIVGGWVGTETITPYVAARVLAALESRLQIVAGIDITAYPVANLDAHREGTYLTSEQAWQGAKCWDDSPLSYIHTLENELKRYDYDIVILLRENVRAQEADVEAWLVEDEQKEVLGEALKRYSEAGNFRWRANPVRPLYARSFTPVPGAERQPAEIIVALPGARDPKDQAEEGLGLVLSLAHAIREARTKQRL